MAKAFDFDFNNVKSIAPEESFISAMLKAGLQPPDEIIPDGQIHRFGKNGKSGDSWYVYFDDPTNPGGAAGDWHWVGEKVNWSYRSDLSEAEKKVHIQRVEKARKETEKARKEVAEKAQKEAEEIWNKSKEPENHPYLTAKGIRPYGVKLYQGDIIVPMRDQAGTLHSIQKITPQGEKWFLPGGAVAGHFHTIEGNGKYTYLCEGFATGATIHEVTKATVYVAFSAGNLKTVAALLPDKNLIIAADNDHKTAGNPGETAAKATGKKYVMPIGIQGTDFNDLVAEKGIGEAKRQLSPGGNKFQQRILMGDDLHRAFMETLSMGWTIHNILPESSMLTVVFGPPSGGKSFAVLDMCMCINTGKNWHDYPVQKKGVLYLAAEGQTGMLKRIKAWETHHKTTTEAFALLPMPCIIDHEAQRFDLLRLVESLPFKPGIIVLDTLARSMQGDENSTKDMGLVVAAAGTIIEETGAQVIIIHHTGKDETKGARGAIALTGATDTMFKVVRSKMPKQYYLICERQKDFEPFEPMTFNMTLIDTGYKNKSGDAITSLVPEIAVDVAVVETGSKKNLSPVQKKILKILVDIIKTKGKPMSEEILEQQDGLLLPEDMTVSINDWRKEAISKDISTGELKAKYQAFNRTVEQLITQNYIDVLDGEVWIKK